LPAILPSLSAVALSAVYRLRLPRLAPAAIVTSVVTAAIVLCYTASARFADVYGDRVIQKADAQALRALVLPSGSVVLANAYTEGVIAELLDSSGLLEGRAPYTYPDLLNRANTLLRDGARFYADPAHNLDFLRRNHVGYIIIAAPDSYALTESSVFDDVAPMKVFGELPPLVRILQSPGLSIFRVTRALHSS
jgi:hypothetical protein